MKQADQDPVVALDVVRVGEQTLRFVPPLILSPERNEASGLWTLRNEDLGIDVYAATFEDLPGELADQLELLWNEYALADDVELTPSAQNLKRNLLGALKEV
jgi:hypothetical protein